MICRGIGGFVISQPFVVRADQQFFRDAFPERVTLSSNSTSVSRPRDLVFVVNPRGANGRTVTEWRNLFPFLKSRLGADYNIREAFTSGPAHAIDITREAIREGVNAVIAVGGDGTLHGVVNGFFSDGKPLRKLHKRDTSLPAIGLIPLGTGSDFSRTFGWKNDPHEAVDRLAKGVKSTIDVGVITGRAGEIRCFINVADIHLSAKAGYYSSGYKSFGNLCYIIGALKAFTSHHNQGLRIKVNEGSWERVPNVTALCIGNGKFFGGGMKIAPNAEPDDGYLEVVILQNFKWHDFVLKLHKLYRGTHIFDPNVTSLRARCIEVEEVGGKEEVYVQCDGEHLGFLPMKFNVIPAALHMIC